MTCIVSITFRTFLLLEGGHATERFGVQRANKQDIEKAIGLVSKALGIDSSIIRDGLLGSTNLTLAGKKQDSGDIDIAMSSDDIDMDEANQKMLSLTNNEGALNKGTNIGSYAVDVGGKKVQVDLMFVKSKQWAKFIYHSAHGDNSTYPGAVRNLILMAAVRFKQEAGKDVVIKKDDQVIARASRALKLDTGLERLFKMAMKHKKTGKIGKNMQKVDPSELQQHVDQLVGKPVKFSHDAEIVNDPDKVAAFIFGAGVKAKDLMTTEQVIEQVKKLKNAAEIFKAARADLKNANLPIPKEMP